MMLKQKTGQVFHIPVQPNRVYKTTSYFYFTKFIGGNANILFKKFTKL